MVKCWFCKTRKGKRYCAPIENILCPICCGEARMKKIECIEVCRYFEGVAFQKKRDEEKRFSKLMENVPHGQYDDIFKETEVKLMAGEIEAFVRNIYIADNILITDHTVYESYKLIYKIFFGDKPPEERQIDDLTQDLLYLYTHRIKMWEQIIGKNKIGQVLLRLMISVKKMSGSKFGEFGYLNYLKNNLGDTTLGEGQFMIEDKFGNRILEQL